MKTKAEGDVKGEENELVSLCQTMCSRGLRRYILSHLAEVKMLGEQVPEALKSAPKPSKLVFECIGRFFLQGSKAYTKDSPMVTARLASVLVLEYYLLSGRVDSEAQEEDPSLNKEASQAAVSWRKRLIVEGGVANACEIDARGLVLFIACYGIPIDFLNEDVWNLVRLSNPREISKALRQSQALLMRVTDIAEVMMKRGKVVDALDLAYTFGFEEKFSPKTTLTSFLYKSDEVWKKAKQDARDFPILLKEANEKYLAALKSIVNSLEGHKVDLEELLPGWELKEKILILENDISDINKIFDDTLVNKRKMDKNNSSIKMKVPEAKRTRFPVKDQPVTSPSLARLHEQRFASHMDGSLTPNFVDGRLYGHPNYPSAAYAHHIGSVSGSLPESYHGSAVPSRVKMLGGAIADPAMSAGIGYPPSSFSGYQGDAMVDNVGSKSYLYRWQGIEEGSHPYDRSVGQSFVGQPSPAQVNHLYGRTSAEGLAGLPDHLPVGVPSRSRVSDLYSFADSVFDA